MLRGRDGRPHGQAAHSRGRARHPATVDPACCARLSGSSAAPHLLGRSSRCCSLKRSVRSMTRSGVLLLVVFGQRHAFSRPIGALEMRGTEIRATMRLPALHPAQVAWVLEPGIVVQRTTNKTTPVPVWRRPSWPPRRRVADPIAGRGLAVASIVSSVSTTIVGDSSMRSGS